MPKLTKNQKDYLLKTINETLKSTYELKIEFLKKVDTLKVEDVKLLNNFVYRISSSVETLDFETK